jgi:ABC-type sugar transport system ATPase subunit
VSDAVVFDGAAADDDGGSGGNGTADRGGPVLEVKGLDVGYGKITVARDITFNLQPRTVLTILGPNGAGKTTLLMTLAGFLPPRAGNIRLNGRPVRGSSPGPAWCSSPTFAPCSPS